MALLWSGGDLWAVEKYWTEGGVLTGNPVSISDFSWIPECISVAIVLFLAIRCC